MRVEKKNIHENRAVDEGELQITLDDDFNVSDTKPDIELIVKEKANIHIDTVKVIADKAQIQGNMEFCILYLGQGQTGEIPKLTRMTGNMEFRETINLTDYEEGMNVSCFANLEDLTVKTINSRKISVKTIVKLVCVGEIIADTQVGCSLEEVKDSDKCQQKISDMEYTQLKLTLKDNLRIRENTSIPAVKPQIEEILWEEVSVDSFNTRLGEDYIDISGDCNVFIMYRPMEEEKDFVCYETKMNFSGKLDINGCGPDMINYVKYDILSNNIEVKPDYDGEMRDLSIEMVLSLDIKVYEDCIKPVLVDVYSPIKCIKNSMCETEYKKLVIRNNSRCRVVERIKAGEYTSILQVVNVSGCAQIDDYEAVDDSIIVDGVADVNVLYLTADENMPVGCVKTMIPFSHKIMTKADVTQELDYTITAKVENISAILSGVNEIEVKSDIYLDCICFEKHRLDTCVDCEICEYSEEEYLKFPGIVGYIANCDEDIWELAKKYHTTIESIKNINKIAAERAGGRIKKGDKLILVKESR